MVTPLATPKALEPPGRGNEAVWCVPQTIQEATENSMFTYPFHFSDVAHEDIVGTLLLEDCAPAASPDATCFRSGQLRLDNGRILDLIFTHSPATASFMYLWDTVPDSHLFDIIGLPGQTPAPGRILLPGQLLLGAARTELTGAAIGDALRSPAFLETMARYTQNNLLVLPVLREGAKYRIGNALFKNYGYYCDEALVDSHHVFDPTVPRYNRRVETTIVKDQDISPSQRKEKTVALIGDSIASGIVMLGVFKLLEQRFEDINQLEVVAPFATLRGLARLAFYSAPRFQIRVHIFETILNALPPDYYYSAHFSEPEFHIRPELEEHYRQWWGSDAAGNSIADTACAGYGWAEAFFHPRKQIRMIDEQLMARHQLAIADIVKRNLY